MTNLPMYHPFARQLLQQFRLADIQGTYQDLSDAYLLKSWFTAPQTPDLMQLQIKAFYQAIAAEIERQTGKIADIFLNFNRDKYGSALLCCGNLVVFSQQLTKVNHFCGNSMDYLAVKAENLIDYSVTKIKLFF